MLSAGQSFMGYNGGPYFTFSEGFSLQHVADGAARAADAGHQNVASVGSNAARAWASFKTTIGDGPRAVSFEGVMSFALERDGGVWKILGGHTSTPLARRCMAPNGGYMKLSYIKVFVSDLAASLHFYQGVLGLELQFCSPEHGYASFVAGEGLRLGLAVAGTDNVELVGRHTGIGRPAIRDQSRRLASNRITQSEPCGC